MSNAPETKYTDRDVRENEELIDAAIEYVEEYAGEFEYLIDMKMRLASGGDLTTPMIRGILNCMRHDPRVVGLPAPLPHEPGTVTPIATKQRQRREKRKAYGGNKDCPNPAFHSERHDWEDNEFKYYCDGKYAINRGERHEYYNSLVCHVAVDAYPKPHILYVAARGGALVHQIMPQGEWDGGAPITFAWKNYPHSWGWFRSQPEYEKFDDKIWSPDWHVKTRCRYPSFISNGHLLTLERAHLLVDNLEIPRKLCPHCMPEGFPNG